MARTPGAWQQKAIDECGGGFVNTTFEVDFEYATEGGQFTVTFGAFSCAPVAFPCSAESLQTALCLIPLVGANGALVTGPIGGPFEIEMVGGNCGQEVPLPTVNGSALLPSQEVEVALLSKGQTYPVKRWATQLWDDSLDEAKTDEHRYLLVKEGLLERLIGQAAGEVDMRTGEGNSTEAKMSQRYTQLSELLARTQTKIASVLTSQNAGKRKTAGAVMVNTTTNGLPYGQLGRDPRSGRLR